MKERMADMCKYTEWLPIVSEVEKIIHSKGQVILAIDGKCGSGKTVCAQVLQEVFDGNVYHMDDYYLPIAMRNPQWRQIPAANMDLLRFQAEVLEPTVQGVNVCYRPYCCREKAYGQTIIRKPKRVTVVEGSYSMHPQLADSYDLKVYLTVDEHIQKERLMRREGNRYPMFEECWIPLENEYHRLYQIKENADFIYDTSFLEQMCDGDE